MTRPAGSVPQAIPGRSRTASVAIVSDASGPGHQPPGASVWAAVVEAAGLIDRLTGLPAVPLVVEATGDAEQLARRLRGLPPEVRAVYLTGTEPGRAHQVQRHVHEADGPSLLTEQDATAVVLTAALLVRLTRAHRAPQACQVIIAGARALPPLPSLLVVAGVGDVISWNPADRASFPLPALARHAHALIDLLDGTADVTQAIANHPHLAIITPGECLLAVPGLLHTLAAAAHPVLTVDVLHAAAAALTALTPPAQLLPELTDPDLTRAVADAATRVLAPRPSFRREGP
jgi:malic enzyme